MTWTRMMMLLLARAFVPRARLLAAADLVLQDSCSPPAKAVLIGGPAPAETMVAAMVGVEILHVGPDCTCYAFLFLYKLVEAGDTEKLR